MSDEAPALPTQKTIQFGGKTLRITEPVPIQAVSCEAITEFRMINNIVSVSFATLVVDGDDDRLAEGRVCARLRISLETLSDLQQGITTMIEGRTKAREAAN